MALKRRQAEASKDAANEYAAILAKRVNEEKAKKTELRSKSIKPMYLSSGLFKLTRGPYRAPRVVNEEVRVSVAVNGSTLARLWSQRSRCWPRYAFCLATKWQKRRRATRLVVI